MNNADKSNRSSGSLPGKTDMHQQSDSQSAPSGMSNSMHDGVEVWCDCCSCEAEPYWIEAMQNEEETTLHGNRLPTDS